MEASRGQGRANCTMCVGNGGRGEVTKIVTWWCMGGGERPSCGLPPPLELRRRGSPPGQGLSPEYGDASPLQVRSGRLSPEYGDASPLQVQSGRLSGAPRSDKNCHIMVQM